MGTTHTFPVIFNDPTDDSDLHPRPEMTRVQWEYRVIMEPRFEIQDTLNDLGAEGWEIDYCVVDDDGDMTVVLKRQLL